MLSLDLKTKEHLPQIKDRQKNHHNKNLTALLKSICSENRKGKPQTGDNICKSHSWQRTDLYPDYIMNYPNP